MLTYQNACINSQSVKVWWRSNTSDMNSRQLCTKIPKKRNKIKKRSITGGHIWHIYISKCVYWSDIHSVKVWWRYVLPNKNTVHFCDLFLRHRAQKQGLSGSHKHNGNIDLLKSKKNRFPLMRITYYSKKADQTV